MCLSTILDATSKEVIDWIGQRGAISLANLVSLATSEAELLVTGGIPSEALDVLQRTLEILIEELPHASADVSGDLAVKFCKLYSKIDSAWGTIWLKYQLRPIHERLLGTNSVYSSAWSQMQGSGDSHQRRAGAALWTGHYVASDVTDAASENRRVVSNQIDIQPAFHPEPSDDVSLLSHASVVSLFQPPTVRTAESETVPLEDSETEPIPLASYEQAEAETAAIPESLLESSTIMHRGSREALEDLVETTAVPDNGRP
jgi:hypothetical protein